ncbi:MAG: VWA domain-containing protein [Trueperaceae bacterium]
MTPYAHSSPPWPAGNIALLGAPALMCLVWLVSACAPQQLTEVADAAPPSLRILEPTDGATVDTATPQIDIAYGDEGSGVSVVSFRATINGRDYSAEFDHDSRGALGVISPARPLPLGENLLVVELSDRGGNANRAQATFINAGGGWLEARIAPGAEPRRSVELILDASGSMQEALGTSTRMIVAKEAVGALVGELPVGIPLGLRVFNDCADIVALAPIAPVDPVSFVAQVEMIEPSGGTPLVASLLESFDALSDSEGERIAVLVTDGGESCGGSLEEAANRASDAGVRVVVIGFDIADAGLNQALRELAEGTGGAFFDARDPTALGEALERGVLRMRYQVLGETGEALADGDVGGERLELPLGTYAVRVDGTPPLLVDEVTISPLGTSTIVLSAAGTGLAAEVQTHEGEGANP